MRRKFVFPIIFFVAFLFLGSRVLKTAEAPTKSAVAESPKKENVLPEKTVDLSPLKIELENQINAYKGEVSFALIDLKTGKSIGIKPQEVFYPASSIKILALISILKDVQDGRFTLSSVEPTILNMMMYSSNSAANSLISKTGFDHIKAIIDQASLFNTTFIHGFDNGSGTNIPRARIGSNSMSAGDAVILWQKLFEKDLLNSEMTKKALEYAKLPNVKLIFAPKEASVYHKPGYIGTLEAETYIDTGVVETDKFVYAVAYFSRKNPSHQAGADFAQSLTKTVYQWVTQNY